MASETAASSDKKEGRNLAVAGGALPAVSIAALDRAAAALDKNAAAPNTVRSYASDWESWCAFCGLHGFTPLPAEPEHVRLYLVQLVEHGGRKGGRLKPGGRLERRRFGLTSGRYVNR